MEIINKRIETQIKPEDMDDGKVYRITLDSADGVPETCIAMPMYNGNITTKIENNQILLVDLKEGCAFIVRYNEIIEIEELNAKLIIE